MSDDSELLHDFVQEGSQKAFTELVQRHAGWVYGLALRRLGGDRMLAEDAVQTVFTRLAVNQAVRGREQGLSSWLHTTTRYVTANLVRAERRRRAREQIAADMTDSETNQEGHAESTTGADSTLSLWLDDLLAELKESERTALLLRFMEMRSFAELGQALRLHEDAARKRVDRALQRLRLGLKRRGVTTTGMAIAAALTAQGAFAAPMALTTSLISSVPVAALAGTASHLSFLSFMSAKTTVYAVTTVAVLALGIGGYETWQAVRSGQSLDALRAEVAGLQARSAEASKSRENQDSKNFVTKPGSSVRHDERASLSAEANVALKRMQDRHALLATHPEYRDLMDAASRSSLHLKYLAFYHEQKLTTAQVGLLERAELEKSKTQEDTSIAAYKLGLERTDPGFLQAIAQANEAEATKLKADLGSSVYAALQYYQSTNSYRNWTDQLAVATFGSTTPLSSDQSEKLVEILAQSGASRSSSESQQPVFLQDINWEQVEQRAVGVLSADQMDTLSQVADKQRWQAEYLRTVNGIR